MKNKDKFTVDHGTGHEEGNNMYSAHVHTYTHSTITPMITYAIEFVEVCYLFCALSFNLINVTVQLHGQPAHDNRQTQQQR